MSSRWSCGCRRGLAISVEWSAFSRTGCGCGRTGDIGVRCGYCLKGARGESVSIRINCPESARGKCERYLCQSSSSSLLGSLRLRRGPASSHSLRLPGIGAENMLRYKHIHVVRRSGVSCCPVVERKCAPAGSVAPLTEGMCGATDRIVFTVGGRCSSGECRQGPAAILRGHSRENGIPADTPGAARADHRPRHDQTQQP